MHIDDETQPAGSGEPENATQPETATDPLSVVTQERDELRAIAQRAQADLINYRKRVDEERAFLARNAANGLLSRVIPVVDDLRRAVEAIPAEAHASWSDGVRLVLQNLESVLQAEGVTIYAPEPGEHFDPAQHEAVYYQPSGDQPPGAVLQTVRAGYRTADRVLRAAQVVVAREPEQPTP